MIEDTIRDKKNGKTYQTDMAGPKQASKSKVTKADNGVAEVVAKENEGKSKSEKLCNEQETKPTKKKEFVCATCGQKGHARNSHLQCLKSTNEKSIYFRKYHLHDVRMTEPRTVFVFFV